MIFFFPALDLIGLACEYGDCLYLSNLVTRQATLEPILTPNPSPPPAFTINYTQANTDVAYTIGQWQAGGLGQFASSGTTPTAVLNVNLAEGTVSGTAPNAVFCEYVHVTLDVPCKPFLPVPFFMSVPGLNAPITFEFHGRGVIEYVPS